MGREKERMKRTAAKASGHIWSELVLESGMDEPTGGLTQTHA